MGRADNTSHCAKLTLAAADASEPKCGTQFAFGFEAGRCECCAPDELSAREHAKKGTPDGAVNLYTAKPPSDIVAAQQTAANAGRDMKYERSVFSRSPITANLTGPGMACRTVGSEWTELSDLDRCAATTFKHPFCSTLFMLSPLFSNRGCACCARYDQALTPDPDWDVYTSDRRPELAGISLMSLMKQATTTTTTLDADLYMPLFMRQGGATSMQLAAQQHEKHPEHAPAEHPAIPPDVRASRTEKHAASTAPR